MSRVVVSVADGVVAIANRTVAAEPVGDDGALRVGGQGGPILGPVPFAVRTRIVHDALGGPSVRGEVAGSVLRAATRVDGKTEQRMAEAIALHLAGAGSGGPSFATATVLLARVLGWGPAALGSVDAAEVDRLAGQVQAALDAPDAGWSRIVFQAAGEAETLDDVWASLCDDLLARAVEPLSPVAVAAAAPFVPVPGVDGRPAPRAATDDDAAHPAEAPPSSGEGRPVALAWSTVDPGASPAARPTDRPMADWDVRPSADLGGRASDAPSPQRTPPPDRGGQNDVVESPWSRNGPDASALTGAPPPPPVGTMPATPIRRAGPADRAVVREALRPATVPPAAPWQTAVDVRRSGDASPAGAVFAAVAWSDPRIDVADLPLGSHHHDTATSDGRREAGRPLDRGRPGRLGGIADALAAELDLVADLRGLTR